jgi:hypothetical protein
MKKLLIGLCLILLLTESCSKESQIHTERWQVIVIKSDTLISHVCLPKSITYDTINVVWNNPNPVSYLNGELSLASVKDGIYFYEYFVKQIN